MTAFQTLDEIEKYVENTGIGSRAQKGFDITTEEIRAIHGIEDEVMMLLTAFRYGRAKGYRAGKRAAKK